MYARSPSKQQERKGKRICTTATVAKTYSQVDGAFYLGVFFDFEFNVCVLAEKKNTGMDTERQSKKHVGTQTLAQVESMF
jgi:hypothetical protein